MAEGTLGVTAGAGSLLHVNSRTIGVNTVLQQVVEQGEPYLATYTVVTVATSIATADAHILQIMAGASLPVYLRALRVYQVAVAGTEAIASWQILRLSTAGTGGTAVTPAPLDSTDSASGAAGMTLPTAKGTETTKLWAGTSQLTDTVATGGSGLFPVLIDLNFDTLLRSKGPRIAAGTSNGLALKWLSTSTSATAIVVATISEATF